MSRCARLGSTALEKSGKEIDKLKARREAIGKILLDHRIAKANRLIQRVNYSGQQRGADMTQSGVGSLIHVSRQTISNMEHGRVPIDIAMLEVLMEALEISPETIWPPKGRTRLPVQEHKTSAGDVLKIVVEIDER